MSLILNLRFHHNSDRHKLGLHKNRIEGLEELHIDQVDCIPRKRESEDWNQLQRTSRMDSILFLLFPPLTLGTPGICIGG